MIKSNLFFIVLVSIILSCSTSKPSVEKETNTAQSYLTRIKNDKVKLRHFFQKMPKGGDLHHHASGTPYAEELIENAVKDSCYINPKTFQLYFDKNEALLKKDSLAVLITELLATNPTIKDSIIDNWSVRNHKINNKDGHDLFFSTFTKFKPAVVGHAPEILSTICKKANTDNISYIETMIRVAEIHDDPNHFSSKKPWESTNEALETKFEYYYNEFKNENLKSLAKTNADSLYSYYNKTNKYGVTLRFQTYGVRLSSNHTTIFKQLVLAFETASICDILVGINFVAPEDNLNALKNYSIHMKMFKFLKEKPAYAAVNISLHAGELVLGKGSTKETDLKFHIKEALQIAHAKRIGHGVDLESEDDFTETLNYMKENQCAVEINLESNEIILETNVTNHPVNKYLEYGVPVCISTDDEGVLRTNLTNQYVLLTEYVPNITYKSIKEIVYNSITYSFLDKETKDQLKKELNVRFKLFEGELFER